jgi:CheY-like chemotaxis protein
MRSDNLNGNVVIEISFPNLSATPVLVIDDNEDALRLMERYAAGTRYVLSTTHNSQEAVRMAQRMLPRVIVLDVMMPGLDGFEMLGRLRQHPSIESVPIIVCTVLDQEPLARSLGASAFLRKPITRQGFLGAIDRQVAALERR